MTATTITIAAAPISVNCTTKSRPSRTTAHRTERTARLATEGVGDYGYGAAISGDDFTSIGVDFRDDLF